MEGLAGDDDDDDDGDDVDLEACYLQVIDHGGFSRRR